MTEQDRQRYPNPDQLHRRFGLWLLLSLAMLAGLAGLGGLALTGRMVAMPDWVTARIEARLNAELAPAALGLEGVEVMVSRATGVRVKFTGVTVIDAAGRYIARLPELDADISPRALAEGRLGLRRVALGGAEVTLRRAPDGRFDLALGAATTPISAARSLAELLDELDRALGRPGLADIEALSIESLALSFEDARAGRMWRLEGGLLTVEQDAREVALRAFFSLRGADDIQSELAFSFVSGKGSPAARFSANFSDVPAADVASQSPALAALALLDAPISGAVRSEMSPSGLLGPLNATLEIGAGLLRPAGGAPPIRFSAGKSYFTYDPDNRRLNLDQIALDTAVLRLTAEGHAYLEGMASGWPDRLVGQLAFRSVALDPAGMFERPVVFDGGAMDIRIDLDPLIATVGQAVLLEGGRAYRINGTVRARPEGWQVAMDARIDELDETRLLSLWPVDLVPETREWFARNVLSAKLGDIRVAVRHRPGKRAELTLAHEFRETELRYLATMPPISGGAGYAMLHGAAYTLVVEKGTVRAPDGGMLDLAGSVMQVPDVTSGKTPPAEFTLKATSTIPSVLSLLDLPPLRIASGAGIGPDMVTGRAEVRAVLRMPLKNGLIPDDVDYDVSAILSDLGSDSLIPGLPLFADRLDLGARPDAISIRGDARLAGIPLSGRWQMVRDDRGEMQAGVTGRLALSWDTAAALGLEMPAGSLSGEAEGRFRVELPRTGKSRFTLESDLKGLSVALPGFGVSKAASTAGTLSLRGDLGGTGAIDLLTLSLPGLHAEGGGRLSVDGGLAEARFERVMLGDWLDATVVLTGQGAGRGPRVAIAGGMVDLRGRELSGVGALPAGGDGQSIDLALDRLRISDAMEITQVKGRLSTLGGLSGQLAGRMGGTTPVTLTLVPAAGGGTALRLRSARGGEALRDAGVFARARGGDLDIVLHPTGLPGGYDGQLRLTGANLKGMPVLTELLSAVSVVGILELMEGEGLVFSEIEARFGLTPDHVEIRNASAIGPSLGVSLDGVYGFGSNRLDMRGVISPIYLLNSVGSVLTRKGEGLFGFSFRVTGNADSPQVRVNPLSILTPGMFREIFRGAAPKVQQ
ncbi:AsmA-like protein [Rhodovulum bhavnagarense]|uniref:AsmA-like protein n=1 Tax=Rhodovulum bhavnagarense TaxID=992286 RepID=A0A4V2SWP8_9RHOB|nr:AsmA-like C-terminal region-containing protein [Rhodovulum bhavnagarense]TCP63286.1 AsmA-like protein [Rhodovulum bhavnagarense]